jgi:alpha-L-rhamnosidase
MATHPLGRPTRIRFDHGDGGPGSPSLSPRLSWTHDAIGGVERFEIESTADDGRSWTATVDSADRIFAEWVGPELASRERRTVRVRAIGADGAGPWSEPASVEAGLDETDWSARLVGPSDPDAPTGVLRTTFVLDAPVVTGRISATFHGIGIIVLNGEVVGDAVLEPGWHSYRHRLLVRTHDVTDLLVVGANEIKIHLGDGWFRGWLGFLRTREVYGADLGALLQLEAVDAESRRLVVATDDDWEWTPGPVTAADLYDGESFDARRALPVPDAQWNPVEVRDLPRELLEHPTAPPVRRTEELAARAVLRSPSGKTLIDFGQNLVGWVRIAVRGPEGTVVTLRFAEVLEQGELGVRPLRTAKATDSYVLAGDGLEVWEPRFTFHGFRYVEVTGWPGGAPTVDDIVAVVVHTDLDRVGGFQTSHPALSRLHENVVWSARGNFVSLPTDCPQRDERLGWTGDIAVFASTATFLFDCTGMLMSWLRDLALEQTPAGAVPHFVPAVPFPDSYLSNPLSTHPPTAVWGDAAVLVPFALYEETGDVRLLEAQYSSMTRWVDLVAELAAPSLVWDTGFQYGDWLDPVAPPEAPALGTTDPALVATAYFVHSARLVARAGRLLGRTADEERFLSIAERAAAAFVDRFVLPDGRLTSDSQSAYAIALQLDLLDEAGRRSAGARLIELVRAAGHRIETGFVGTPLILDALTSAGSVEDAYGMLLRTEHPSWLYPITMGATTIWERWDSLLPDGSINPGEMTSFNHYAFGAVAAWLHSTVAGLSSLAPAWRRIRFAPRPHTEVRDAAASHRTPYGIAAIRWRLDADDILQLELTVPAETSGVLELPGGESRELGPGSHTFEVPWTADVAERVGPTGGAR